MKGLNADAYEPSADAWAIKPARSAYRPSFAADSEAEYQLRLARARRIHHRSGLSTILWRLGAFLLLGVSAVLALVIASTILSIVR